MKMSKHTTRTGDPAKKTIEAVLDEFLQEQRQRLKPSTTRKYEDIIELFGSFLDGYAHQSLSKRDNALLDRFYEAEGEDHWEFCQLFGPDKIPGNVSEFLNYFMIRKVMCGKELKQAAATVTKKLGKWLQAKGYITPKAAAEMVDTGAVAAKELPAAEELAWMLADYADRSTIDYDEVVEDYFSIQAVEPGMLHLSGLSTDEKINTPVPQAISDACRKGWSFSGAVAKTDKGWRILEVWNVYP